MIGEIPNDLSDSTIHIWTMDLTAAGHLEHAFLSTKEKERASQFRFPYDAHRFCYRKQQLRRILGHYLKLHPRKVSLGYTEYGKPYVANESSSPLKFNMSSSRNMAICVIAQDEVGIDIEYMDTAKNLSAMTDLFLTEQERLVVEGSKRHGEVLYKYWVAKEAAVKCWGMGLSLNPTSIYIDWQDGLGQATRREPSACLTHGCYLTQLNLFKNYATALASNRKINSFCLFPTDNYWC